MLYLRESVTADSQQGGLGFGGLGGRVGTTLSIAVKRTRLLEDTLRILGEVTIYVIFSIEYYMKCS